MHQDSFIELHFQFRLNCGSIHGNKMIFFYIFCGPLAKLMIKGTLLSGWKYLSDLFVAI